MPGWEPKRPESSTATSPRPVESSPREYQAVVMTNADVCDYCASPRIVWRKCKLICEQCGQINKSCADL